MRVLLLSTPHPLEEAPLPPLSLAYLAGALESEGVEVQILDFLVARYRPAKLRQKLDEFRPQLVGATCVTLNYPTAARMLKACKDFDSSIVTVIGGPHATFALNETLLRAPWIDAVAIGEGDRTVVELARAVEGGNDIRQVAGIAFADGDTVVKTEYRPQIDDLDQLPMPSRHLLPLGRYKALGAPCTVITSRGCPYHCIFCSGHRMFGGKVRFRDPGLVVDEIEQIHRDLGFPQVNIVDDTFTLNHRHAGQVCEEMLRRNLEVKWSAFARVDTVTKDLAELMKRAGCTWVLFGVESSDEGILKTIKKGITPDKVRSGVKIATDAGIKIFNSFIFGLPGESPDTARRSIAFGDELDRKYGAKYGFHILSPLPGTELYERAKDYHLHILSRNWARYDANQVITESPTMSPDMVREVMAVCERNLDNARKYIRRRADAGDPEYTQRIEEEESRNFVWRLLSGDVVERLGRVAVANAIHPSVAEAELVQRVSRRVDLPFEMVQQRVGNLVADDLLRLEPGDDGLRWRWSDGLRSGVR